MEQIAILGSGNLHESASGFEFGRKQTEGGILLPAAVVLYYAAIQATDVADFEQALKDVCKGNDEK